MSSNGRDGNVRFFHYSETSNVGDFLCSPRHYFTFESERDAVIVGGGASNSFFASRARKQRASVRIAWGIGQSFVVGSKPSHLEGFWQSLSRRLTYAKASTRDPSLVSHELPLVPCVSVFHPVTELTLGCETGIFLNFSNRVSGDVDRAGLAATDLFSSRVFTATNGLPVKDFMHAFERTATIITNSYHAAYWGLLSGRAVHIIGYSSKFTNLAALFGFPEDAVIKVGRGDREALNRAIVECAERTPLRILEPDRVRVRFRECNLDFARTLAAVGVFATLIEPLACAQKL